MLRSQPPVRVVGVCRPDRAVGFPPGQKLALEILVGGFAGPHAGYPQPLHQPVLRRLKTALDTALGLRRMRPDAGYLQVLQRSPDLRRRQLLHVG